MNRMEDVLETLRAELGSVPEIEPPAEMWSRFEARLDAEIQAQPAVRTARVRRMAPVGKLVLVPSRS
jgi:hypothetical protein